MTSDCFEQASKAWLGRASHAPPQGWRFVKSYMAAVRIVGKSRNRRNWVPLVRIIASMKLTEEHLLEDLELLRHGGAEAISLFMEMARRMHKAADDGLQHWVTLALPALPERERAEVVLELMSVRLARSTGKTLH